MALLFLSAELIELSRNKSDYNAFFGREERGKEEKSVRL